MKHGPTQPERRLALPALALATAVLATPCATWAQSQDALHARSLAATCANCHGTQGVARGEMKVLAGLPAPSLVATMAAYKAGTLPATIMSQIAKGYSDAQIALIADYFAAQPLPTRGAP